MAQEDEGPDSAGKCNIAPRDPAAKALSPAARRALAEAEARRKIAEENRPAAEKELGGRKEGLEPTRYGDWENKGILSDF